ncbi:unnamed protein product [Candidula unifasciata]|uniref:DnaJ homolog subfamily C member 17 n=1 Tax=Candidula unifasciata TaxID=100452 RepID=A0A8S3ZPH4_9EUPU|nr:unnamed protein product [Candidula unifasciata]
MAKDLLKQDLYSILEIAESATEKEIISGYRKKALKCHPDKNPDNPKAAELFHELSKALEILTDTAARAAYDQTRKAKKAAEARNKVLDSKRKKFKEDLEAKERALLEQTLTQKTEAAEKKLQREIERLRKEGSRLLEQEQERLRQELKQMVVDESSQQPAHGADVARIKLKWKAQKDDPNNGGYSTHLLQNILSSYGRISALIVSSKRKGSAIVEFEDASVDSDILDESGLTENPFTIVWLSGKPVGHKPASAVGGFTNSASVDSVGFIHTSFVDPSSRASEVVNDGSKASVYVENSDRNAAMSDRDFESLVLMKMRQAEERKRLIEQMMKEDD